MDKQLKKELETLLENSKFKGAKPQPPNAQELLQKGQIAERLRNKLFLMELEERATPEEQERVSQGITWLGDGFWAKEITIQFPNLPEMSWSIYGIFYQEKLLQYAIKTNGKNDV